MLCTEVSSLRKNWCRLQVGDAITRAVSLGRTPAGARLSLPNNLTEGQVADALLAGLALAAKSCGPPNSLSSSGCVLFPPPPTSITSI